MASQTIGEAAAIPPAALWLAANDDFAEVMFAGVMEDRFLFRRVGEGGGFGPSSGGRSAARARRRPSGSRCRKGSRHTPHARRCRAGGEPGGGAHQLFAAGIVPDTEQDRIAGVPDFLSATAVARARICSSTRSAVRRRASSRSAIRCPCGKSFR